MSEISRVSRKKFLGGAAVAAGSTLFLPGGLAEAATRGATRARAAKTAAGKTASAKQAYELVAPLDRTALAGYSRPFQFGAEIAVKEINDGGGIQGRPIRLRVLDIDGIKPEGVSSGFKKAMTYKPDAIYTAAILSNPPANAVVAANPVPYLGGNTSIANVEQIASSPKYFSIFQYDPTELPYGAGIVPFLNTIEADGEFKPSSHTVYVIEGDGVYEQTIIKAFMDSAKKSGKWKVVGVERISKPVTDWGATLNKIRDAKPGVIVNTDYLPDDAASFLKQFTAKPTNSLIYFQYVTTIPGFYKLAGKAGEGVIGSTHMGFLDDAIGQTFKAKFQERSGGQVPDGYGGAGYDMTYMLANAWGRVGDPKDVHGVCRELKAMRYRGVNGTYWMDRPGQYAVCYPTEIKDPSLALPHLFYQGRAGKNEIIYPRPYTSARYTPAPYQKG